MEESVPDNASSIHNQQPSDLFSRPTKIYLLVENPRKSNNLGPIIRCANAFGISTIVAIGYAKCSVDGMFFHLSSFSKRVCERALE